MTARRVVLIVLAIVVVLPLALLGGVVLLVQSEWGERWLETQVSQRIHREVQVEDIRVRWDWPPALAFGRIRIANPDWAQTPNLIDANQLYANFEVMPLFRKRLIVPYMSAARAEMGLEISGDRATWHFGDETSKDPSRVELVRVSLEDGHVVFRNEDEDTAIEAKVKGSLGQSGEMNVDAKGKFRGEPAKVAAKFPGLMPDPRTAVRFEGKGSVGRTEVIADGSVAGRQFETLDLNMKMKGPSLKHLSKLTGVVLPDTPPYNLDGHMKREGTVWVFDPFNGKIGDSDLAGSVTYRKGEKRPFFQANLKSKLLDFDDLGPLVGTPPKTGAGETSSPEQKQKAAAVQVSDKVLPKTKFETERWDDMDADVKLEAAKALAERGDRRALGDVAVLLRGRQRRAERAVGGEERVPLDAVDPELRLGVVRAVRLAGHGVGPAHLAVHVADHAAGPVGLLGVAEDTGGDVVRRAL